MRKRHVSRWYLWLLLPVFGVAAFLESSLHIGAVWHKVVEVGIVLLVFGLLWIWLQANQVAWLRESADQNERDRNA